MKYGLAPIAALLAVAFAATPSAAALTHAYEFSGSGVTDSVGTDNGTLNNGATVSGGMLHLDGIDDSVGFGAYLVPTGGAAFSVFIRVDGQPDPATHTEIISQAFSGGGFYVGTAPGGNFRLTDAFTSTGIAYHSATRDLLLTSGAGGTKFYIDGGLVFSNAGAAASAAGGSFTRFGQQFAPYSEYFKGDIDAIRIYDSVILPGDVVEPSGVPEPATWAMMMFGFGVAGVVGRRQRRGVRVPG